MLAPRRSAVHCVGVPLAMLGLLGLLDTTSTAAEPTPAARSDELATWLDERFAERWQEAGVAVQICDDAAFVRRLYLDLLGRIPSVAEVRDFLANTHPGRHSQLVDKLLFGADRSKWNDELHAEHLARIWRRMMIPPGSTGAAMGSQFEPWLVDQFRENVGYDELARQLVTGGADEAEARGPSLLYQAVGGSPEAYASSVSRVFLGTRIGCAQCHDHPFTDWKQRDFWGMAAFFTTGFPGNSGLSTSPKPGTIQYEGMEYAARFLGSDKDTPLSPGEEPRFALAEWLASPDNTDFAATAVNRTWQYLLGRGLVAAVDDLDVATVEERQLVLDPLAKKFAEADFDLRWLVAGICKSRAYRCPSAQTLEEATSLLQGTRPLKTLTPEQLFDSLEQALALPISKTAEDAARHNGQRAQLLARFDESAGLSPEDYAAGIPQVLMLMNGRLVAEATDLDTSRTLRAVVDAPFLTETEKLDTLYLATFSRRPTLRERELLTAHLRSRPEPPQQREAYAEIFWALLNSPEFVLCR